MLKRFDLRFKDGVPAVQCGRWVGFIPLNARYALEVGTRVPVANLERLIGLTDYAPETLAYLRHFSRTAERPSALFDVLANRLLDAFDQVWEHGLIKDYARRERVGSSPVGKIDPFKSAWRTAKAGRPVASSSAFERTPDNGANRLLRQAFERLLGHYSGLATGSAIQRDRLTRIRRGLERLKGVGRPTAAEVTASAVTGYVRRLPAYHEGYPDALVIAQIVVADMGPAIRGAGGLASLPSILVNMEEIYERYARRLLAEWLSRDGATRVLNGNVDGAGGAKAPLFTDLRAGLKNPPATPDIVIADAAGTRLIIDVKYRPSQDVPDPSERNQVIGYGARFGCDRIMILYAGRKPAQGHVAFVGRIGAFSLFTGHIDLGAESIMDEERAFVEAVAALVAA
ncbi:restriction endonuclease [uncultured Methylobacterium sp.]|uniref:5-methylcytosine restriction system specificity protein McrC n=1 Tax=uncultured Methylobacterium sp. TaxID=157278 RepID=UPI0035CA1710